MPELQIMKITSEKKAAAVRANGARSRGPVTAEGKRRSSRNAITHGLCAKTVVIHGEDPNRFEALVEIYSRRLQPRDAEERAMVRQIAANAWRLRRQTAAEMQLRNLDYDAIFAAISVGRHLSELQRAQRRLLRDLFQRRRFPKPAKSLLPNEPIRPSLCNRSALNEPIIEPITKPLQTHSGTPDVSAS
jgi:hypothetical protein